MVKAGAHKRKQVFAEINITPLTDIFLVLLTIMIVVAPFMRQMRSDLHLPEVTSGAEVGKDVLTVDVTKDGQYFINGAEIAADNLGQILHDKAAGMPVRKLVVQADKDAKAGAVLKVFQAAEDNQYEQMTVLGQAAAPPQEKKPDEAGAPGTVQ